MRDPQRFVSKSQRWFLVLLVSSLTGCEGQSQREQMFVQHKSETNPAMITAVEYFLPAMEMPQEVRDGLHPWIRQMVGKQPAEVSQIVAQRWSGIENPSLQDMRDRLLEFVPDSIVVHKGQGWLSLRLQPGGRTSIGEAWYLPAPGDDAEWARRMKRAGIENTPVFLEFVKSFGGLREDIPDMSGNFLYVEPWATFPLPGYELSDITGAEEWQQSLIVYVGRGGDSVLLHPSGRVGWWLFAEHEIVDGKEDFESFVEFFTNYSRKYSYPFDVYAHENALR